MAVDNKDWVFGHGYEKEEMLPEVALSTLEFVERSGKFHVYRLVSGVNKGKLIASYNNQPEIRHLISENPHAVFAVGFFKAYSSYIGYDVELTTGKAFVTTIARIALVMKGTEEHKRSISTDPSGIVVVR
jgi:hypothetical protein